MHYKEENIIKFYKARVEHFRWLNRIKLLISGFKTEKNTIPSIFQESKIGVWYYSEGIQFARFHSKEVLEEIEVLLENMFDIYAKIHLIYFESKKGFFGRTLGVNENEKELCRRYYEDIVVLSDQLKNKFALFERQLLALTEDSHAALYHDQSREILPTPTEQKPKTEQNYTYGPRSH